MAFKAIEKKNKKHDCEDFKPYFFDKRFCKYSFKCANAGYKYISKRRYDNRGLFDLRCTGIRDSENLDCKPLPEADPNLIQYDKTK